MASTTYETQYVPKEQRELPMMAVDEVNYNPFRPIPSEQSAWEWFMKYDNSLSSFCVSWDLPFHATFLCTDARGTSHLLPLPFQEADPNLAFLWLIEEDFASPQALITALTETILLEFLPKYNIKVWSPAAHRAFGRHALEHLARTAAPF